MKNIRNLSSYNFSLPVNLIAQEPIFPVSEARLLVYERKRDEIIHTTFKDFFNFIPKDSLIVLNNTKVIKARIYGEKRSGGKIELLYHKDIEDKFLVQIKGKVKEDEEIYFKQNLSCKIIKNINEINVNGFKIVSFKIKNKNIDKNTLLKILNEIGVIPLPPYIKSSSFENNYQSIFGEMEGAIAAPTASLHFDENSYKELQNFNHCFITLHVGAGTFLPMQNENILMHEMHSEYFKISAIAKQKIENAKKILCIGTTACRCIEYFERKKEVEGECDIFLHPLNPPLKTNYLLTNFHLPKSSLLVLVSAFIGLEKTLSIYEIAKNEKYRFYSYGDGMLIL